MPSKFKIKLPRYMIAKRRKNGYAFYFQPVKRHRPQGWKQGVIRLPDDLNDAIRMAKDLYRELQEMRIAEKGMRDQSPETRYYPRGSIPWVLTRYQQGKKYKRLSKTTQQNYGILAKKLLTWSNAAGHAPVTYLTAEIIEQFLDKFNDTPHQRNALKRFLHMLLNQAVLMGVIDKNPATGIEAQPEETHIHIWTDQEIAALVRHCDKAGRRSVGTAVLIAADTGQRQGDVLKFTYGRDYRDGSFRFFQNKTGADVIIPATQRLKLRLNGAAGHLVGNERTKNPYKPFNFRHLFRKMANGAGLGHVKFAHLRHTCVVRLARSGCSVPEIAAITGHTLGSVETILKRYLMRDSSVAENAITKLEAGKKSDTSLL